MNVYKKISVLTVMLLATFSLSLFAAEAEEPKALPADGGEPGKVYMEYCKAMKDGKVDDLKKLVSAERAKQMEDPEFPKMFAMVQELMAKDIKITGGKMTSKEATLTAEGKDGMTGEPTKGEIHMVLEGKEWKVEKDSWKSEMK
jgi:hypothetical protein